MSKTQIFLSKFRRVDSPSPLNIIEQGGKHPLSSKVKKMDVDHAHYNRGFTDIIKIWELVYFTFYSLTNLLYLPLEIETRKRENVQARFHDDDCTSFNFS